MTTPKKAPTAFDDVLTLVDALRILAERRPVKRADLDSLHDSICVLADHSAAERAEAEAAQEPGDSVEGFEAWGLFAPDGKCVALHERETWANSNAKTWRRAGHDGYVVRKIRCHTINAIKPDAPATDECLFQHTNNDEEVNGES